MDELISEGHNDYSHLPEEQAKDMLRQEASQDPNLQAAKQKTRQLMVSEARKIMPDFDAIETELKTLIDRVLSLKWPEESRMGLERGRAPNSNYGPLP